MNPKRNYFRCSEKDMCPEMEGWCQCKEKKCEDDTDTKCFDELDLCNHCIHYMQHKDICKDCKYRRRL